jgi:hypothetical protein
MNNLKFAARKTKIASKNFPDITTPAKQYHDPNMARKHRF